MENTESTEKRFLLRWNDKIRWKLCVKLLRNDNIVGKPTTDNRQLTTDYSFSSNSNG